MTDIPSPMPPKKGLSGLAIAGIVTGGIVCGFYALIAFFEIVVFLLTGGPIPAY